MVIITKALGNTRLQCLNNSIRQKCSAVGTMCSIGVIFMCFCAIFQSEAHLRIVVPQQNGIYVPPYAGVAQNGDGKKTPYRRHIRFSI